MTNTTPQAIERELLEITFLEDGPPCSDWSHAGCKREATHFVICPCDVGHTATCDACLAKLRVRASKRILGLVQRQLWFHASCRHTARFAECSIRPI